MTRLCDATRKIKSGNEKIKLKLAISRIGVPNNPSMMIQDLTDIFSPLVASIRGQCELISGVEAWSYKAWQKRAKNSKPEKEVDIMLVREKFSKKAVTKATKSEDNVEGFIYFLIRLLWMLQMRGITVSNVKPSAISFDGWSEFKFDGLSYTAYAKSSLRLPSNRPDKAQVIEDCHQNERWSAAMTLLQFTVGTKRAKLEEGRRKDEEEQIDHAIASFFRLYPLLERRLGVAVSMLLDGKAISIVTKALNITLETIRLNDTAPKSKLL